MSISKRDMKASPKWVTMQIISETKKEDSRQQTLDRFCKNKKNVRPDKNDK